VRFSVHPVAMSVTVRGETELSTRVAALAADQVDFHVSRGVLVIIGPSPHGYPRLQQRPGFGVRTALEDQVRPGRASRRSIVAADIPTSRAEVPSSMSNSPNDAAPAPNSARIGASRFPAGAFLTAQHFSNAATTFQSYFGARGGRGRTTRGFSACFSARRA